MSDRYFVGENGPEVWVPGTTGQTFTFTSEFGLRLHQPSVTPEAIAKLFGVPRPLFITYPWERPHRNPFPHITPLPRLKAWQDRYSEARTRIIEAVEVLRYGVTDRDDW